MEKSIKISEITGRAGESLGTRPCWLLRRRVQPSTLQLGLHHLNRHPTKRRNLLQGDHTLLVALDSPGKKLPRRARTPGLLLKGSVVVTPPVAGRQIWRPDPLPRLLQVVVDTASLTQRDSSNCRRYQELTHNMRKVRLTPRTIMVFNDLKNRLAWHKEVACKSISKPLRRRTPPTFVLRQNHTTITVDNMTELVGKSTSLAHGVIAGSNSDESDPADRIAHRQSMLLRGRRDDGDIDTGRLLNDADKISDRPLPQPVLSTKALCSLTPKNLSTDHQQVFGMA